MKSNAKQSGTAASGKTTVADLIMFSSRNEYAELRDRMRAVILRRQGKTFSMIGQMVGRAASTVKTWNDRFKADGFDGLRDRPGRGSQPRLGLPLQAEFRRNMERRFHDDDPSTAIQRLQQVRDLIRERYGVEYSRSGVQALMQRLGFSKLKPRPKHAKRNDALVERWKTQDLPLFCANAKFASPTALSRSGFRMKRASGKRGV